MADLKALTRRFYDEVFTNGDLSVLDELVDDGFVEHEAFPGMSNDKAGLRDWIRMMHEAFPDVSMEVVALAGEGDEVWAQAVMRGTHKGEFMGIPASGKSVEVPTIERVRIRNGKAVEHWGVTDTLTMMQQLGVVPEEA
ncbi:MAG: ester cyclase [Acidimicrobiia bacterium]